MPEIKVSNQKANFVPRERKIYRRITVIVFDVVGDFNHITWTNHITWPHRT